MYADLKLSIILPFSAASATICIEGVLYFVPRKQHRAIGLPNLFSVCRLLLCQQVEELLRLIDGDASGLVVVLVAGDDDIGLFAQGRIANADTSI